MSKIDYNVKFNEDDTVTISKEFYGELFEQSCFLATLEAHGVDNWCGYGGAQAEYNGEEIE